LAIPAANGGIDLSKMVTFKRLTIMHAAILSAFAVFATSAASQTFDEEFDRAFDTGQDAGRAEFLKNCAPCHGADGKGTGIIGVKLETKPADLTLLAKKNHGTFSADTVYNLIEDGTAGRLHLSADMPLWDCQQPASDTASGTTRKRRYGRFRPAKSKVHAPTMESLLDLPCDAKPVVDARILSIIGYLSRIQEK
jgi:mono/diheme cytochrome c family protein